MNIERDWDGCQKLNGGILDIAIMFALSGLAISFEHEHITENEYNEGIKLIKQGIRNKRDNNEKM